MTTPPTAPKRALVTGGSGGIGTAICRALAAMGVHVVVHANTRLERAQSLAAALVAQAMNSNAAAKARVVIRFFIWSSS